MDSGPTAGLLLIRSQLEPEVGSDKGDAESHFNYGSFLFRGWHVQIDKELAAYYFKLATDQGHASAQFNYGLCLAKGDGVRIDL
jgi:TPR repeat protein